MLNKIINFHPNRIHPNFRRVLYIQMNSNLKYIDYAMDAFSINYLFNRNTTKTDYSSAGRERSKVAGEHRFVLWLTVMSSFWQRGRSLCQCLCWGQTWGWSTPSWGPIGGDRTALVKGGRQTDHFQQFTTNSRCDQDIYQATTSWGCWWFRDVSFPVHYVG